MDSHLNPYALNLLTDVDQITVTHNATLPTEAVCGSPFEARAGLPIGAFSGSVLSAPAGSTAAWSGSSFSCDLPGRYKLRGANGTTPIDFDVIAFPAEALTFDLIADKNRARRGPPTDRAKGSINPNGAIPVDPRPAAERRALLRQIAQGGKGKFADSVYAALNSSKPVPDGISW